MLQPWDWDEATEDGLQAAFDSKFVQVVRLTDPLPLGDPNDYDEAEVACRECGTVFGPVIVRDGSPDLQELLEEFPPDICGTCATEEEEALYDALSTARLRLRLL